MGFAILIIALVIGTCILNSSSSKNEAKSREEIARMNPQPEHYPIDNSPSGGAWAACVVIAAVAAWLFVSQMH